jgi:hypothetical protein
MTGFLGYPIGNSAKVDVQKFGPDFNNGSRLASRLEQTYLVVSICVVAEKVEVGS